MKLLDSKIAIEQYIADSYNETEIHWSGMKFDTEGKDEWVYFQYVGELVSDCGFDDTEFSQSGSLQVSIVARTSFRCNELGDIVLDMFKATKIDNLFAGKVRIITHDYLKDIDKSVLELDVMFSTL